MQAIRLFDTGQGLGHMPDSFLVLAVGISVEVVSLSSEMCLVSSVRAAVISMGRHDGCRQQVKQDMAVQWQKIYEFNYHKSLDHRSFYFKQVSGCMARALGWNLDWIARSNLPSSQ